MSWKRGAVFLILSIPTAYPFVRQPHLSSRPIAVALFGSFSDDSLSNNDPSDVGKAGEGREQADEDLSLSAFQAEMGRRQSETQEDVEEFDGYDMRDVILNKWGECFDVDFQKVNSFGFQNLYLNVLPFRLGSRRFRHETEMDYLCHLQAIVEILVKYDQLGYVLYQIEETTKKPRAGTSPLVAVPLRLDLTPEQVQSIVGYR